MAGETPLGFKERPEIFGKTITHDLNERLKGVPKKVAFEVQGTREKVRATFEKFLDMAPHLSKAEDIFEAVKIAAAGKIIESKTKIAKIKDGDIYSMEVTLKGKPRILSLRASNSYMDVALTDLEGKLIQYYKQDGSKVIITTPKM